LNDAVHMADVTQLRHDTNGRVYFDKKIVESKIPKEANRALKRRISDSVYKALTADVRTSHND
jgi:transposase